LMKDYFEGKPTAEISPLLPAGAVKFGEKWVTSEPIFLPGHAIGCYVKGKFDSLVEFSDSTFGVVDFKTSQAKPEHVTFYSRQLHAYTYALEHPAAGSPTLSPITRMGLLCVEPVLMDKSPGGQIAYMGKMTWLECPKDEAGFLAFLDGVLTILEKPEPPEPGPNCSFCRYREVARQSGL
jgi:hypothetical protein